MMGSESSPPMTHQPPVTHLDRIRPLIPILEGPRPTFPGLLEEMLAKKAQKDGTISYSALASAYRIERVVLFCDAEPEHSLLWRRFAWWCAAQASYGVGASLSQRRSILRVIKDFSEGNATESDLSEAQARAWELPGVKFIKEGVSTNLSDRPPFDRNDVTSEFFANYAVAMACGSRDMMVFKTVDASLFLYYWVEIGSKGGNSLTSAKLEGPFMTKREKFKQGLTQLCDHGTLPSIYY